MSASEDVPLGQPSIRWWELDDTSSHFERAIAAPSDETLFKMWTALSVVNFIDSIVVAVILIGLASSKTVRKLTFNCYLIFLMIPDL